MKNGNKKLITIIFLLIVIIGGTVFFSRHKTTDEYQYQISQNAGKSTKTGSVNTANNSIILAYASQVKWSVEKISTRDTSSVRTNTTFLAGDSVSTDDKSEVEIIFADNSIVRLAPNSKISFTKLSKESNEMSLEDGTLWARVLKPFYDASFFTIATNDLSAGVRGTSVLIKKQKKTSQVHVIDSYSDDPTKVWVFVSYKDFKDGKIKETTVKPEQNFIIDMESSKVMTWMITNTEAFKDRFIRRNTQKDLVYMDRLQSTKKDDSAMMERLQWEMAVTFPQITWGEMQVFYSETKRGSKDLMDSSGKLLPNAIMKTIEDELMIDTRKAETEDAIEDLKKQITPENRVEIERQIQERKDELQKMIDTIVPPTIIIKPTLLPPTINTQATPIKTPTKVIVPVKTEPVKLPADNPITTPEPKLPKPSISGEVIIR